MDYLPDSDSEDREYISFLKHFHDGSRLFITSFFFFLEALVEEANSLNLDQYPDDEQSDTSFKDASDSHDEDDFANDLSCQVPRTLLHLL